MISLIEVVNKVIFFRVLILVSVGSLFSCTTAPQAVLAPQNTRIIETKAQIKNEKESHQVKIQTALWPNQAIRLEVTATLGVSVASVLMTPKQIQIVLPTEKTYIVGPFAERTLYPVFKQNISPRLIWKIIHNHNPADQKLNCQLNENKLPIFCQHLDGAQIKWTYEAYPARKIEIKRNTFEMIWIFRSESPLSADQNETFVLKKPENYKEIVIK